MQSSQELAFPTELLLEFMDVSNSSGAVLALGSARRDLREYAAEKVLRGGVVIANAREVPSFFVFLNASPHIRGSSLTSLEIHFPVWTDDREVAAVATGIRSFTSLRRLLLVSPEPCLAANRKIGAALASLTSIQTIKMTNTYTHSLRLLQGSKSPLERVAVYRDMTNPVVEPFSAADILARHQATLCSLTVEPGCVTCLSDDGDSDIDEDSNIDEDSDVEDMDCTEDDVEDDGEGEMQVDYEDDEDDAEMRYEDDEDEDGEEEDDEEDEDVELPVFTRVTRLEIPNLPGDATGDEYRIMFPAIRHLDLGDRYHNWCGKDRRCREQSKFTTRRLDNEIQKNGVTDSWRDLQLVRGGLLNLALFGNTCTTRILEIVGAIEADQGLIAEVVDDHSPTVLRLCIQAPFKITREFAARAQTRTRSVTCLSLSVLAQDVHSAITVSRGPAFQLVLPLTHFVSSSAQMHSCLLVSVRER